MLSISVYLTFNLNLLPPISNSFLFSDSILKSWCRSEIIIELFMCAFALADKVGDDGGTSLYLSYYIDLNLGCFGISEVIFFIGLDLIGSLGFSL